MPATSKADMTTRRQQQASQKRLDAKARKACVEAVWKRAEGRCEDCGVCVEPIAEAETAMTVGHVHEVRSRSLGGDETDPNQCLLLCFRCHFNGPSGAHRRSVRQSQ